MFCVCGICVGFYVGGTSLLHCLAKHFPMHAVPSPLEKLKTHQSSQLTSMRMVSVRNIQCISGERILRSNNRIRSSRRSNSTARATPKRETNPLPYPYLENTNLSTWSPGRNIAATPIKMAVGLM